MSAKINLFDANGKDINDSKSGVSKTSQLVESLVSRRKPIAYVRGAGHFLPEIVFSNIDLGSRYDLRFADQPDNSVEQFSSDVFKRTGIMARRHALDEPSLVELAVRASNNALANSAITIAEVTHIVVGSTFFGMPSHDFSQQIQAGLGSSDLHVETLEYACASAGYCIARAIKILESSPDVQNILVVGVDKGSSFIDFKDPGTAILFGDGAGALVISRRLLDSEMSSGIFATTTSELPQFADFIFINANGKIEMPNGPGVFQQACKAIKVTVDCLLSEAELRASDLDLLVLHQANMRLPAYVARSFHLDPIRVPTNIRYCGNTCAASPLILASEASQFGLLKKGNLAVIGAVGLGMRASGALLSW